MDGTARMIEVHGWGWSEIGKDGRHWRRMVRNWRRKEKDRKGKGRNQRMKEENGWVWRTKGLDGRDWGRTGVNVKGEEGKGNEGKGV